jgi:hypothetical protein
VLLYIAENIGDIAMPKNALSQKAINLVAANSGSHAKAQL